MTSAIDDGLSSAMIGLTLKHKTKDDFDTSLQFEDYYETVEKLRSGSYGTVYTCRFKHAKDDSKDNNDSYYAVKIMDRQKLKKSDKEAIFKEAAILQDVSHIPSVVRLLDFFVSPTKLYMVQVYASGGDVFDRLAQRTNYTEKDARELARLLLETMHALHTLKPNPIVHRDLKPENLLLESSSNDRRILVADFGFARRVPMEEGAGCQTRCGTPAFVAPEVVLGLPYKTSVDLWSTGCLLYMLLGGYPPFQASNHRALFRKIRAADFVFHAGFFKNVSISAKQLISNLLTVNVEKRWTAEEALQCDWFTKQTADQLLEVDLSASVLELKKNFNARRSWKAAADAIRWASTAPFWNADKVSFHQQLEVWDKKDMAMQAKIATSAPAGTNAPMNKLPTIQFKDAYDLGAKLRSGSYASVWECTHKVTNERYAVKIILRKKLHPKDDEAVLNEVAMMQSLADNKYVVHLMDFYEEEDSFYIVLEYMAGGDVFDRIVSLTQYTELDARNLTLTLLRAVGGMHSLGIVHRDLKPQNLLLRDEKDNSSIKVADFGFARRVHTPESLTTRVGTPTYVAPEVLKNIPHDHRVDLWSIGVIVFVLLVGYPPFMEDDQPKLFQKIRTGEWSFHEDDWKHISRDAKDLIRGFLQVDPKDRWTIEQALKSRWINQDPSRLSSVNLSPSVRLLKAKRNRLRTLARAFRLTGVGKDLRPMEVVTQAQDTASNVLEKLLPQPQKGIIDGS